MKFCDTSQPRVETPDPANKVNPNMGYEDDGEGLYCDVGYRYPYLSPLTL